MKYFDVLLEQDPASAGEKRHREKAKKKLQKHNNKDKITFYPGTILEELREDKLEDWINRIHREFIENNEMEKEKRIAREQYLLQVELQNNEIVYTLWFDNPLISTGHRIKIPIENHAVVGLKILENDLEKRAIPKEELPEAAG